MNRFPFWKYCLLAVVLAFGIIYAMPNLYAPDPAIQVTGSSQAAEVDHEVLTLAREALEGAGIEYISAEITEDESLLVRLTSLEDQLPAQRALQEAIAAQFQRDDERYVVALNQASTTPQWLSDLGASSMNLGLDLAGGVHFLLEVDTPQALADRLEDMAQTVKRAIRDQRLFNVTVNVDGNRLVMEAPDEEKQQALVDILREELPQLVRDRESEGDRYRVIAQMSEQAIQEIEDHAVSQNLTTIRNRVNELGVSEPLVQKQGSNRIVVELPGIQDTAGAKKILGKTANLEFRLQAKPNTPAFQKQEFEFYTEEERQARGPIFLERRRIISGEHVVNAQAGFDQQSNGPKIDITLDSEGGNLMHHATRNEVGTNMGVLFIDYYTVTEKVKNEAGEIVEQEVNKADKKIINLATIRNALGVQFQITGLSSSREANEVALLLRAGSLAAPMRFVEERTIGPSLGAENIASGVTSVQLGLLLVVLFMLVYYKVFGLAANLALAMNMVLLVALMSILGATLTLPGIAGIVLTVGMAVDANVLIFSRIKEEIANGVPPQSAIHGGFERAFTTILDANLTTLIVAFILFAVGTGPVKGFAVTLSLGILTSMFTAIWGTRAVVNLIYGGRRLSKLWI